MKYEFITSDLPTVIDAPGEYLTRKGETVKITTVSPAREGYCFSCDGWFSDGIKDYWHPSGRHSGISLSNHDIISKK